MSCTKKFVIPSADEVLHDDLVVKSHFKPGRIINTSTDDTSSAKAEVELATNKTTTVSSTIEKNSITCDDVTKSKGPHSAFEDAFSSLKDSKFYEIPKTNSKLQTSSAERTNIPTKTKSIIVNAKQKGNPLLKHIRSVPWEFGEIEPDYLVGQTTCVLFLSVRYHNLFPNYIHERLKSLGKGYQLRILLLQLDMSDPYPAVRELSRIAILTDLTLMCAWSAEEAGKYLETYKMFENKSAELIMERQEEDMCSKVVDALSSVKSVNQTDALTLLTSFGSLEKVVKAKREELVLCPGMGTNKANKLFEAFHQPFLKSEKKSAPT